jgi:hypothetical protein
MPAVFKTVLIIAFAGALLGGCAATPEASPQDDAEAKRFDSAPGAAIVYLYRADAPSGRGSSTLWLDDRLIGESLPYTYFRTSVRPGKNLLTAFAGDAGRLAFETSGGEVYFIAIIVRGDDGASGSVFRLVSPDVGRAQIVRCCTLLETWKPGQKRMPL